MTPPIRTEPRHEMPGVHLQFSAARFVRLFATVAAGLCLVHILLHFVAVVKGDDRLYGLVYMFGLGAERNPPTLYSTVALLVVAGLLLIVARHSKTDRLYWWVLGVTFVFLALDETMGFHEKLVEPVKGALKTSGAFHYAWIIPYGLAALAFGIAFSRFLLRLPRHTAKRFVVAGAIFVMGAVGMEMVGGAVIEQDGAKSWSYWSAQTAEEMLEMLGVLLFLYALVAHIDETMGGLTLRLGNAAPSRTEAPVELPGAVQPREAAKRRVPDAAS
ncbi:MAG TPA: hypothetical protein VF384_06400 [Planctomycetota bacterium]